MDEKQQILEFVKNLKKGNAQVALKNLKTVVDAKQRKRERLAAIQAVDAENEKDSMED